MFSIATITNQKYKHQVDSSMEEIVPIKAEVVEVTQDDEKQYESLKELIQDAFDNLKDQNSGEKLNSTISFIEQMPSTALAIKDTQNNTLLHVAMTTWNAQKFYSLGKVLLIAGALITRGLNVNDQNTQKKPSYILHLKPQWIKASTSWLTFW